MGGFSKVFIGSAVALCAACVAGAQTASPAGLFIFDQTSPSRIWDIDVSRPSISNALVTGLTAPVPEVELFNGSFYASTNSSANLFRIDAGTGALVETIPLSFPTGGNVITAMEHANGILYGGFATVGGSFSDPPSRLVTIDTNTGQVNSLGILQNIDAPIAGLAFGNGVMYAVNAPPGGPAALYSVNLFNGISTSLGLITEEFTGATIRLTGLEFGLDGVLYGLGRASNDGVLFSINPANLRATRIGALPGLLNGTSLTSGALPAPAPGPVAVIGAAGLFVASRRRRSGPRISK